MKSANLQITLQKHLFTTDFKASLFPLLTSDAPLSPEDWEFVENCAKDPNIRYGNGNTALHLVVSIGNWRLAVALVEAGLDPLATNDDGKTASELAAAGGFHQVADAINSIVEQRQLEATTVEPAEPRRKMKI